VPRVPILEQIEKGAAIDTYGLVMRHRLWRGFALLAYRAFMERDEPSREPKPRRHGATPPERAPGFPPEAPLSLPLSVIQVPADPFVRRTSLGLGTVPGRRSGRERSCSFEATNPSQNIHSVTDLVPRGQAQARRQTVVDVAAVTVSTLADLGPLPSAPGPKRSASSRSGFSEPARGDVWRICWTLALLRVPDLLSPMPSRPPRLFHQKMDCRLAQPSYRPRSPGRHGGVAELLCSLFF